ncbi:GNAT family N-acetyltransferase [Streptomyces sp. Ru73]|uniref:GNAT family N-acetyltransferase n=1 Tax=Streptomyces sp. Ru73 TaxID=2080748 RepID=UPI000CDD608B|nr:GNAT family N-acetyltransferase [Streptomyces sp. Ru73]POX42690.1 GNAT family N-acetyltransferase [Streptomyces sp. Ru73]
MTDKEPVLRTGGADNDLEELLGERLDAFNNAATGGAEETEFSVRVTDTDGGIIAGLTGWTWGDLGGIELLWVHEDHRQAGWGTRLLQAAEAEARRRGCARMAVSTYSFQAPAFYARHGYRETGRLPGLPGGHEDVHFLKELT